MRVLELTMRIQAISRTEGRSATAAAAYRACDRIECERQGVVHDYRRKEGLEASAIFMPGHAPSWMRERSSLWNAAEMRERNGVRGPNAGSYRAKAKVAREIVFGFPAELSADGRRNLAATIARHLVEVHGLACDLSLHEPGKLGDQRNWHCHLLFSTRRVTVDGFGAKAREWDDRASGSRIVTGLRAYLAGAMNAALAEEGHGDEVFVEHRSFKARGSSAVPTKHQGPGRTNAKRIRQARERQTWERDARRKQTGRHASERAEQAQRQASNRRAKLDDIAAREARAIEAARPVPAPTTKPAGIVGRVVQGLTGRATPAPALPDRAAEAQRVAEIRAGFEAERQAFRHDQAREVRDLADRQERDDRQLERAAAHRTDHDRATEAMDRRQEVEGRERDRTHSHEHERVRT